MKRPMLIALIVLVIGAIAYLQTSTTPVSGTRGQPCNNQDEENTGCAPGLLCGQGTPENNFVWTCMTLSDCVEKDNTANAVEGSTFCFIGI